MDGAHIEELWVGQVSKDVNSQAGSIVLRGDQGKMILGTHLDEEEKIYLESLIREALTGKTPA